MHFFKDDEQTIPWKDSVSDLTQKYTEAGVALKGARIKENMSQNELASKLGIPQSHISDMEHGRRTSVFRFYKFFYNIQS